jgi:cation transport protein ChaC
MLTREDLENDTLRKNRELHLRSLPLIPEAEFIASFERILATWNPADDLWVFGYGSLIWNPLFHHVERQNVTIHGFHRSFCLCSRHGRGSVEEPGLMLGLDFGGCCNGVALRIAADKVRHELMLVWRREMAIGSYAPRWITASSAGQKLRAVAFVVNHAHPHYAGKLPFETITKTLATAKGRFGTGATHGVHHPIECPEVGA